MVKTGSCVKTLDKVIDDLKNDKIAVIKAQTIVNAVDKELKAYSLYLAACKQNGIKPEMKHFTLEV